jgi:large subunit ribosomal protein L9
MDVILLDKVENLGGIGDKVSVRPGYARNFLIPQGKATPATTENLAAFEARRAEIEKKAAEELAAAEKRAAELGDLVLEIRAKAGGEGKLFGSIGTIDIAEAAAARGIEIHRSEVRLPEEGPMRSVGEYEIELHLHTDVNVTIKVAVVAED